MSIPNTFDLELAAHFVEEIDKHDQEIVDRQMEVARFRKERNEMKARIRKQAKAAGIPKAVLDGFLEMRAGKRKIEKTAERIEAENRLLIMRMAEACKEDFSHLPLGEWGNDQPDTSALDEMADDGNPST